MKKKRIGMLSFLLAAVLFGAALFPSVGYATEQTQTGESEEQTSENMTEETEYPESYYLPIESNAIDGWPSGPQIEGEAAVVMDAETGAFLYSKNMEAKEYPASITKIMTTLVALENGNLKSKVKFSEWAVFSLEEGSSRLWMDVGEKMTLKQALYGVMLESANDCANAVAEKVGGSQEGFADMMNEKAAALGCTNTHFVNAHGLHDKNHYTCAKDMAIITKAAMENEMFREIAGTIEYIIPKSKTVKEEHVLVNHQKMLYKEGYAYKGCIGGKNGFTEAALNTLVTVAQRKGRQLICVILRTNGPEKICWETRDLLDYGFHEFARKEIPVSDGNVTRGKVMTVADWGKCSVMNSPSLKDPMMIVPDRVAVSLPKGTGTDEVERAFSGGNGFAYTYHGWRVSFLPVTFNAKPFESKEWKLINTDLSVKETEPETEELSMKEKAGKAWEHGVDRVKSGWENVWKWIYDHDIAAALAGFVLILLLLPLLVIAYVRNRSSQKIRKQRQREREERIRIERDIDRKSVSEIEAELRAELEKERLEQEKRLEAQAVEKEQAEEAKEQTEETKETTDQEDEKRD